MGKEREKNTASHLKKHQFTSENQPTPEAKSEGVKRWWDRRRLKEDLYTEFMKKEFNIEGENFFAGIQLKLKRMLNGKKLTDKEKSDLILKIINTLAVDEKEKGSDMPTININISKEDTGL